MQILYIAPKLNHYKLKKIEALAAIGKVEIDVLSGSLDKFDFYYIRTIYKPGRTVTKLRFNLLFWSFYIRSVNKYDVIILPYERTLIPLILFVRVLVGCFSPKTSLISYNHLMAPTRRILLEKINISLAWFFYNLVYTRVIFYSEATFRKAVELNLVRRDKCGWANNTIDNKEIDEYLKKKEFPLNPPSLLFIGRLLKYRWIDRLVSYYERMLIIIPNLRLHVIGDGSERERIEELNAKYANVYWHGELYDEREIAEVMCQIDFVFIPGHSGLSINHAFAYEKPYITSMDYKNHPPEYNYLKDNVNGIILTGNMAEDLKILEKCLTDKFSYLRLVEGVSASKKALTIDNWVSQMLANLKT